ncbi:MAG: ATP-binding protein [Acidimicrobiaceae bacterium]|nr:ATP-binding protein [Acidimicrobiaceae bacterium]
MTEVVARCGADVDATEVVLLADELVSNALRHAGRASGMVISGSADSLRVEVIDPSSALPTPARPGPRQEWGRGLLLVERLASQWGADPLPIGGKSVWFEVQAETGIGSPRT